VKLGYSGGLSFSYCAGSIALYRKIALLTASVAAMICGSASAHHSFAAEFDGNKPVRLIGTITQIEWTNPHSYFYLDVKDSKGEVHNWACATRNVTRRTCRLRGECWRRRPR
jgi:hypothetical protein